jgi:CelD/BcsL family acetyltransferase involved in cellulose biosynthesis
MALSAGAARKVCACRVVALHGKILATASIRRRRIKLSGRPKLILLMKVTVINGKQLTDDLVVQWRRLQQSNPSLQSPFFCPEFTKIVASVRSDVEVGIIQDNAQIVALFPFQSGKFKIGLPVGEFISDYQAVICGPDFTICPQELLQSCSLVAWDFQNLLASQTFLSTFHYKQHLSAIIDLSAGYENYVKERREAGTEQIKKNGNLMRRLEREVGPLRFVAHLPDKILLDKLLAWKTEHFRRNHWRDLFSIPWVREIIQRVHGTQTPNFAGMLSALYAGDKLVAAHFGMRSATVWHYWFPGYDPAFSKYSPGVMLLLKMAENAQSLGVKVIDMGCGEHSYKERLLNGTVTVANGSVERECLVTSARRCWRPFPRAYWKYRMRLVKTPLVVPARWVRDILKAQAKKG